MRVNSAVLPLPQYGIRIFILLLLIVLALLVALPFSLHLTRTPPVMPVWGRKPVLAYFLLTPSLAEQVQQAGLLTSMQFQALQKIARHEHDTLRQLELESRSLLAGDSLSLEQKRQRIVEMGYNARVQAVVDASRQAVELALDPKTNLGFIDWLDHRWQIERLVHGPLALNPGARSFRIFATRYDSGGAYTVALPDKCLKFANGGSTICNDKGYLPGSGYTVFLSYQGATAATVNESGPWNVDDNYWATSGDPQPRRMFADLPLGIPEAQAAYFDGYNGGVDQFGRTVTAPFGIDLARQVSIDIGLQPGVNDWITISFMWTEGWGGAAAAPAQGSAPAVVPTSPRITPVITATANPDGSVVHEVQSGQALWSIATTYGVTIQDLLRLNNLTENAVIVPGQKLLVIPASPTITPSPSPQPATVTPLPTLTPTRISSPTPTIANSVSPTPTPVKQVDSPVDPILLAILVVFAIGLALLLVGARFK